MKTNNLPVINVDDTPSNKFPEGIGIFSEVLRQDDNFRYPRQMLAEADFPHVDGTLMSFIISADGSTELTDPSKVKTLLPYSVLDNTIKELETSQGGPVHVKILSYGVFDIKGVRTLQRFHRLKRLRKEVSFERQ